MEYIMEFCHGLQKLEEMEGFLGFIRKDFLSLQTIFAKVVSETEKRRWNED